MKKIVLLLGGCLSSFLADPARGETESPAEASSSPTENKAAQPTNQKALDPLLITIIKSSKAYGYLRLEIQLVTKDGTPITPYEPLFPILKDAYFAAVYSAVCDRWIPGQPLKPESLLKIIQKTTDTVTQQRLKNDNLQAFLKNFFFAPANK